MRGIELAAVSPLPMAKPDRCYTLSQAQLICDRKYPALAVARVKKQE
jgi:hypothetical protein